MTSCNIYNQLLSTIKHLSKLFENTKLVSNAFVKRDFSFFLWVMNILKREARETVDKMRKSDGVESEELYLTNVSIYFLFQCGFEK